MKNQSLLCVWALVAAAACGSVSSPKVDAGQGSGSADASAPAGDFSLAANPGSLDLTITGQATVAVDLTRGDGFTDTVALSTTGLPTGVTAMFSSASLADGTNTTNLTITVADTAAPGTSNITITGTTPTLSRTASLELTLSTVNVAGSVRGGGANTTVRLVGKSATVTDANGNFTFTDVKVPYDIYVIGQEGILLQTTVPAVNYYKGLTRPDPVLTRPTATSFFLSQSGSATFDGAKSGGNNVDPQIFLWSTGGTPLNGGGANGYVSVTGTWTPRSTTKDGTLYGIQIKRGALGVPIGYPGFGGTNFTATAGGTHTVNLTYAAPSTAMLTGTITQPTGYTTPELTLTQQFGQNSAPLWNATTTNANSLIPVLGTAGKTALHATSSQGSNVTQVVFAGLSANTDVNFAMPTPPVMTGPVNNATNVSATTPFEFTVVPNAVYRVSMTSSSANFHIFTKTGSVTIPNVSELPIPSATSFTWTVIGFGPATDANRAADMAPLEFTSKLDFEGPMNFLLTIASRTFTTQ